MAFCNRCSKDVWFPCKTAQSELSCKHKRDGSPTSHDSSSFFDNDEPAKSVGGFFSSISDAFSGSSGGYDGGSCDGGSSGGGCDWFKWVISSMVEQRTLNLRVVGSIPTLPTSSKDSDEPIRLLHSAKLFRRPMGKHVLVRCRYPPSVRANWDCRRSRNPVRKDQRKRHEVGA